MPIDSSTILGIINEEEVVRAAIATSATRTNSELHRTVCEHIRGQFLDTVENQKTKKKIDVRRDLTQEQLQLLNDLYPERHIVTSNCERGTHSFAAASRKIETDLILSRIPKNANVYDIGGNWATHLKRKDLRKVHCCCPILDFRDAQRKTTRWLSVEKFITDRNELMPEVGEKLKEIQEDENFISGNLRKGLVEPKFLTGKWYCENKFEDCVFKAEKAYAMAIHSIYDIALDDLANAMEEKRIKYLMGTFLFSVDMLIGKKRGEMTTVDGFYEIDGEDVKYGFYDDTNCGYKHNMQQLMEYLTRTFVKAKAGSVYYLELTEQRGDVMFFSMTDATEARMHGVAQDESFKCIPIDSKDNVVFPLFELDKRTDVLVFSEIILSRTFVRRAVEYTARLKPNQLNAETVNSYLTSTNNTVIIGGSAKKTVEKVDALLIQQITTTLIVWTELMNARQKRVLTQLRLQMKDDVNFSSLAQAAFHKVFGKVSTYQKALRVFARWISYCHGSDAIEFRNVPLYVEITDRVKLWKQHAPNHGFSFDLEGLDAKIELHKELERERKAISEYVASDKLGELCPKEVDAGSVTEVREYQDGRRRATASDLKSGEVFTNFVDDWCNKEDHFNHRHTDAEHKYSAMVAMLKSIWEVFVPSMQFAPVYVDVDAKLDSVADDVVVSDGSDDDDDDAPTAPEVVEVTVEKENAEVLPAVVDRAAVWRDYTEALLKGKNVTLPLEVLRTPVPTALENTELCVRSNGKEVLVVPVLRTPAPTAPESVESCVRSKGKEVLVVPAEVPLRGSSSRSSESEVRTEHELLEVDMRVLAAVTEALDEMEKSLKVVVPETPCKPLYVSDITDSDDDSEPGSKPWGLLAEEESDDSFYINSELISNSVKKGVLPKQPDFRKFPTVQQKAKHEFMWYLRCKITSDRTTLRSIIDDHLRGVFHNGNCELPSDSCFLDYTSNNGGEWVYGKPSRVGHCYGVGFSLSSAGKVIKCELMKLIWDVDERGNPSQKPFNTKTVQYMLLSDITFLMNEMLIFRNLQASLLRKDRTKQAVIMLKDGVPGCGKSTWILNNANHVKDVVLSMGREATLDLKDKFARKYKCQERELKRIRTVDSYLMHDCGKTLRASVVHFDEALMAHAGMVYFCADLLGAKKVICQGDSQQIPFVNRVESISLQYAKLVIDRTESVRMTYRSPIDVAHYLNAKAYYDGGRVTTKNEVLRSMSVVGPRGTRPMNSAYCVPYVKDTQYLTFTQAEKDDLFKALRSKGSVSVNTVHEAQGKTFDNVILVRLKTTENPIYPGGLKSKPYTIVSVTRHRRSLVYYTAVEDRLFFDIGEMKSVMEDKLMKNLNLENQK
ncbi:replicase [Oat golden stripe virus]|nr:replicase [Oat golden stripe virus]CAB57883.1 replicase [Oat golden stripe virus]